MYERSGVSGFIDRRKLFEQVAAHIEEWILSGELKPGDRLPTERELQAQFGVGRPAVREALITLQRSGLIEIANGAPARVAMPTASVVLGNAMPAVLQMLSTPTGQRHFQHVRLLFETALARFAASSATDDEVMAIKAALAANEAALGDRARFISTDIEFHLAIAKVMHNPIVIALHDAISAWLRQQRAVSLTMSGQEETAYRAHVAIYEAVAARDPDEAERAMREHLEQLERAYWETTESAINDQKSVIRM
jgi:GntR family transcriptional regulator, sialic acid-inducible nan operon repressor